MGKDKFRVGNGRVRQKEGKVQKAKMMGELVHSDTMNCELRMANCKSDRLLYPFRSPQSTSRFRNLWKMVSIFVLIFLAAGCASPDPQPLLLGDPVWQSGERSTYRVTNREGNVVGTAQVEITADGDAVEGQGWTFHRQIVDIDVSEAVTVEVRARGYIPIVSATIRTLAQGQQVIEATHNQAQIDIALTSAKGATVYERVNAPSDVRDERTILPLLRTLPLRQGYATFINSFFPLTGFTERFAIRIIRSEQVTVPAGVYNTWLVEMKTTDRTTRAWIATDAPYPLVKFVEGRSQGTFELTNFEPGG